jgi:hypothetical protein
MKAIMKVCLNTDEIEKATSKERRIPDQWRKDSSHGEKLRLK